MPLPEATHKKINTVTLNYNNQENCGIFWFHKYSNFVCDYAYCWKWGLLKESDNAFLLGSKLDKIVNL